MKRFSSLIMINKTFVGKTISLSYTKVMKYFQIFHYLIQIVAETQKSGLNTYVNHLALDILRLDCLSKCLRDG